MVRVAEDKAWAFRARAWYKTNSTAIPKKNCELLASIRGKPAQVVAACVPIELALGSDGMQKIGEVFVAYFGLDGCEGLPSAVHGLIFLKYVNTFRVLLWFVYRYTGPDGGVLTHCGWLWLLGPVWQRQVRLPMAHSTQMWKKYCPAQSECPQTYYTADL